ncbi:hypothetical protein D3C73_363700 [compost metagenome]
MQVRLYSVELWVSYGQNWAQQSATAARRRSECREGALRYGGVGSQLERSKVFPSMCRK